MNSSFRNQPDNPYYNSSPRDLKSVNNNNKRIAGTRPRSNSFRPKPSHSAGNPNHTGSHETSMNLEERATLWANQYKRSLERRSKMKKQKEDDELKECTFQPARSSTAASRNYDKNGQVYSYVVGDHTEHETQQERFNRLHHEADQRMRIRAKAKGLLQENECQEFSFQPNVNKDAKSMQILAASGTSHKPIQERVNEIQRKKAENRMQHSVTKIGTRKIYSILT